MTGLAAGIMFAAGTGILLSFAFAEDPAARPGRELLIVANKGDHSISRVDPASGREIDRIQESGVTGHEVAVSPDGQTAWVPIYGNSGVGQPGSDGQTLDVIDLNSGRRTETVQFTRPARPHCAVFGPDGLLYVSSELTDSIAIIDPHTRKIVGSIPTGQPESHMLAITRDGKRAYTSNVHAGSVSAIDLSLKKVVAIIPVAKVAQRISISPDDRYVFTADQTTPRLAVIETATNAIKTWISLPGIGFGTCPTPDGRYLIVLLTGSNRTAVVDLQSMSLMRTIDVPKAPQEVLVRPDGRVAYISCDISRKIAVLDLSSWNVEKLIDVGPGADGLAWAAASGK